MVFILCFSFLANETMRMRMRETILREWQRKKKNVEKNYTYHRITKWSCIFIVCTLCMWPFQLNGMQEYSGELSCVQHVSKFFPFCFIDDSDVVLVVVRAIVALPSLDSFLFLCFYLFSTIPIFFQSYLKFSYLFSVFSVHSLLVCMQSCGIV